MLIVCYSEPTKLKLKTTRQILMYLPNTKFCRNHFGTPIVDKRRAKWKRLPSFGFCLGVLCEQCIMNCRNKSIVLNDKVIYFSPNDFMACWKHGDRMMRRSLRGNWSNFRLEHPRTQWNAYDWWLVICASRKIFDCISDLRTSFAVYTSGASLIATKENKAIKISHCHIQNSYLLNKFVYLCIYYHASHPASILSGGSVIPASPVRRSAMLLLLTAWK